MNSIIFCQDCGKKFRINELTSHDDKYNDTEGNRHYFFHCNNCGDNICDDCEKSHNCISNKSKLTCLKCNKEMEPNHNCIKEEKKSIEPQCFCFECGRTLKIIAIYDEKLMRVESCHCVSNVRTEKQVEKIVNYFLQFMEQWRKYQKPVFADDIKEILRGGK